MLRSSELKHLRRQVALAPPMALLTASTLVVFLITLPSWASFEQQLTTPLQTLWSAPDEWRESLYLLYLSLFELFLPVFLGLTLSVMLWGLVFNRLGISFAGGAPLFFSRRLEQTLGRAGAAGSVTILVAYFIHLLAQSLYQAQRPTTLGLVAGATILSALLGITVLQLAMMRGSERLRTRSFKPGRLERDGQMARHIRNELKRRMRRKRYPEDELKASESFCITNSQGKVLVFSMLADGSPVLSRQLPLGLWNENCETTKIFKLPSRFLSSFTDVQVGEVLSNASQKRLLTQLGKEPAIADEFFKALRQRRTESDA